MTYQTVNNRLAEVSEVVLATAKSVTGTGAIAGSAIELGDQNQARLTLTVADLVGETPSVTVSVQTGPDGTNYTTLASFTAATVAGSERKIFAPLDRFVRLNVTAFAGTSAVVSVSGETL